MHYNPDFSGGQELDQLRSSAEPEFLAIVEELRGMYGDRFPEAELEIVASIRIRRHRREREVEQLSNTAAI